MLTKKAVLDELERQRDAFAEICVNTQAEHIRQQMTGSVMTLDSIAAWVRAQPTPEPSALVAEAREMATELYEDVTTSNMLAGLASALEAAEARAERMRQALKKIEGLGSVCTGNDNEPDLESCPQCIAWEALAALDKKLEKV